MALTKWIPDRKVWAGGLAGLIGWAVAMLLDVPAEEATAAAAALWAAVSYLVPSPVKEVIEKADRATRKVGAPRNP